MPASGSSLPISRTQVIMFISYLKASVTQERTVIMWFVAICVFKSSLRTGFFCCTEAGYNQISAKAVLEHPRWRQITSLKARWGSCHGHRGSLAPLSRERVCLRHLKASPFLLSALQHWSGRRPPRFSTWLLMGDDTYQLKPDTSKTESDTLVKKRN